MLLVLGHVKLFFNFSSSFEGTGISFHKIIVAVEGPRVDSHLDF